MKKVIGFSIGLALCFGIGAGKGYEQADSCLKLLRTQEAIESNPDSVKVDSCIGSTTFGDLYAKQWFAVIFNSQILPTPTGPIDTIIDRRWEDIDTAYPSIRTGFDSLEQEFGSFFFRKELHLNDTSKDYFKIRFSNYVNIGSVVLALHNIPLLDTSGYAMRVVAKAGVKTQLPTKNFINSIVLFRNYELQSGIFGTLNLSGSISCFDVVGKCIFSVPVSSFSEESLLQLCKKGTYILQSNEIKILVLICD